MNDYRQDNTLSIVAIVLGGLGFLLSLIPCIGFFSIPLGVIGLILAVIAYFKAKDNGDKKTLPIVALCISVLPLLVSVIWYFTFNAMSDRNQEYTYIQDCDSLRIEIEKMETEIEQLEQEIEESEDTSMFGMLSDFTSMSKKMVKMQQNAEDLGCDFNNQNVITIDSLQEN